MDRLAECWFAKPRRPLARRIALNSGVTVMSELMIWPFSAISSRVEQHAQLSQPAQKLPRFVKRKRSDICRVGVGADGAVCEDGTRVVLQGCYNRLKF